MYVGAKWHMCYYCVIQEQIKKFLILIESEYDKCSTWHNSCNVYLLWNLCKALLNCINNTLHCTVWCYVFFVTLAYFPTNYEKRTSLIILHLSISYGLDLHIVYSFYIRWRSFCSAAFIESALKNGLFWKTFWKVYERKNVLNLDGKTEFIFKTVHCSRVSLPNTVNTMLLFFGTTGICCTPNKGNIFF